MNSMPSVQQQLDEITASIPEAIGTRIDVGVAEIDESGVAPGLAVGDTAPNFTLPDALGEPITWPICSFKALWWRRSTAANGARTATFNYEVYKRRSRACVNLTPRS
jgi:hypothetical protein